ncbi:hypothetical protein K2173_025522 [Erythroxylum novogranatense]|uniref:CCHC-type domain-containing protein n=1 Tax=Erythroxylum novogranatense TaxID=1862640 RepID=A0AAV8T8M3_9ROSI|nr:hypothetical protein K2173_025522 [Erythroxylum novogranatense]
MASMDPEGQSTKKGRTRKRDDAISIPKSTYSAAVAGPSTVVDHAPILPWTDEEHVAVEEGDITSEVGEQAFKAQLDHQWEQAVVVKLLGCQIGFRTLSNRLQGLRHLFPNLPIARYHPKILQILGNMVSSLVKIDKATITVQHGRFARLAIELDLSVPLRTSVDLDGETLLVEYEGLPSICYGCGFTGHATGACSKMATSSTPTQEPSREEVSVATRRHQARSADAGTTTDATTSGSPWIPIHRELTRNAQEGAAPHARELGERCTRHHLWSQEVHAATLQTLRGQGVRLQLVVAHVSTCLRTLSSLHTTGKRVELSTLVTNELSRNQADPILSKGAASNSTAQSKDKEIGSTHSTCMGRREAGSGKREPVANLVQLQPTATAKHLALELRSHTEMVCDQIMVPEQPPDDCRALPPDGGSLGLRDRGRG